MLVDPNWLKCRPDQQEALIAIIDEFVNGRAARATVVWPAGHDTWRGSRERNLAGLDGAVPAVDRVGQANARSLARPIAALHPLPMRVFRSGVSTVEDALEIDHEELACEVTTGLSIATY